jgi:hypothetical protein
MSSPAPQQIKFLLYVRNSNCPQSVQCQKLWDSITNERVRGWIKVQDAEKVTQSLRRKGKNKPSWLTGTPTLATAATKPTVWKGDHAVEQMEMIVQHANQQYQVQSNNEGKVGGPPRVGPDMINGGIVDGTHTMSQSTDGEYGRGAAVVNDDLYFSKIGQPIEQSGKRTVGSSDIAEFHRRAAASAPPRLQQSMSGGRM